MSKKRSVHSQKGVVKVNVRKMGSSLKKKSDVTFSFTEIKDRKAKVAVDLDSVVKLGKNYLEMAHLSDFEPEVFFVPASIKRHEISPQLLWFAKLMKKSSFATIRRIGFDLTDV